MRPRSRTAALAILGAAAFALAGCREEEVEAQAFPDLQSCLDAAGQGSLFSAEDCRASYEEAQARNVETAPRYDSQAVCEAQYGAGNCTSEQQAVPGGSGSIFMPLIAGYLIGNMLGGGGLFGGRGVSAQPLYRTADGAFTNPAGTARYANNTGRATLAPTAFAKAPVTAGRPPMTRVAPTSRGGFGASPTRAPGSFGSGAGRSYGG